MVVGRFPNLVSQCAIDLEHMLTDSNRSTAVLAVTTLLKTGVEQNIDRLMKSIGGFMNEVTEEFKITLVEAIKNLCLKFPHKHQIFITFLSNALREEGGQPYKKALVDALLEITTVVDGAKEEGLDCFCEFIEDCEYPNLAIKMLNFISTEGPKYVCLD